MTDSELLRRYVIARDESAFAELVGRHARLVLAAARRLAPADADDVAQATFVLLAQRSGRLLDRRSLAGWLYETTRRCASNARRIRRRHDARLRASATPPARPATLGDVGALLDAALDRLPRAMRDVVLLRHLESLSVAETAERLGVTPTTVTKRSERGLSRLRDFFAARGHATLGVAGVTTLLATVAESSTPADANVIATAATSKSIAPSIAALAKTASPLPLVGAAAASLIVAAVGVIAVTHAVHPTSVAATQTSKPATTTSPAGDATMEGLSVAAARATADAFFSALRDADQTRLEALLARDDRERSATADFYIKHVRLGDYADHPSRITASFEWSVYAPNTPAGSAVVDAQSPTLADLRHLQLLLQPWEGRWRVREASVSTGSAQPDEGVPPRSQPPATLPANSGFAPGDYARALALFQAWHAAASEAPSTQPITDADGPAVIASLERARPRLAEWVASLAETDLAIDAQTVAATDALSADVIRRIRADGLMAFRRSATTIPADARWAPAFAALQRIERTGQTLLVRASAEAELHPTSPRPPAVEAPIELFVAWDGSAFALPGPLDLPPWLRESPAFKQWRMTASGRVFATKDDLENEYEVAMHGIAMASDGREAELVTAIRQYRPDGTLAAITRFDGWGDLSGWDVTDATGERYAMRVRQNAPNRDGLRGELEVTFFDASGDARIWNVNAKGAAYSERTTDPVGNASRRTHLVRNEALPERWQALPFS